MTPLILTLAVFAISGVSGTCVRPRRTTPSTCLNPPVVPEVDLSAYTGRWFNTFVSGTARRFGAPCITANYTLLPDGTISVLNCNLHPEDLRPRCLAGTAAPINPSTTSQLRVSFDPRMPPGSYNVAALLGSTNYGYFAAAVYSCRVVRGEVQDGFFIISRAPFARLFVLNRLKKQLRCKGYILEDEFEPTPHDRKCLYFDGPDGFDSFEVSVFPPRPTE